MPVSMKEWQDLPSRRIDRSGFRRSVLGIEKGLRCSDRCPLGGGVIIARGSPAGMETREDTEGPIGLLVCRVKMRDMCSPALG